MTTEKQIAELVKPFTSGTDGLTRCLRNVGSSWELMQSNPVLLWLLTEKAESGPNPLMLLRKAVRWKRKKIVQFLFGNGSNQAVRFLLRLKGANFNFSVMDGIYTVMRSERILNNFRSFSEIPLSFIEYAAMFPRVLELPLAYDLVRNAEKLHHEGDLFHTFRRIDDTLKHCLRNARELKLKNIVLRINRCSTHDHLGTLGQKVGERCRFINYIPIMGKSFGHEVPDSQTLARMTHGELKEHYDKLLAIRDRDQTTKDIIYLAARLEREIPDAGALASLEPAALKRLHDELALEYEEQRNELHKQDIVKQYGTDKFPSPPVPGNDDIIPITGVDELWLEGKEMKHCVGSYSEYVMNHECYIYKVLKPERATVEIVLESGELPRVGQLSLIKNRKPAQATVTHVEGWLRNHFNRKTA